MTVENPSQWPARPLGLAQCREDAWMSLRVLRNGDDSRNSYLMSTSPVPRSTLSTFLSVSNTLRKGQTWNLIPSLHDSNVYTSGIPVPILPLSTWMGCLLWPFWWIFTTFFFFLSLSLPAISHCFYAWDIHAECVLARGPDKLRHPLAWNAKVRKQRSRNCGDTVPGIEPLQLMEFWGTSVSGASWSPGQRDAAPRVC